MPCYATGSAEGDLALAASEDAMLITELTELLCVACETIEVFCHNENMGFKESANAKLHKWWENHKKIDEQRKIDALRDKAFQALMEKHEKERQELEQKFRRKS